MNNWEVHFDSRFGKGYKDIFNHSVEEIVRDVHKEYIRANFLPRSELLERVEKMKKERWLSPMKGSQAEQADRDHGYFNDALEKVKSLIQEKK